MHLLQAQIVQKQHSRSIRATTGIVSDRQLVRAWRGLLERYHAASSALERTLNEEHQLGVSEFEVLDRLVEMPSRHPYGRVQDLAASVHLSQSALSRAIARLERDGLVSRAICAEDRRGVYVHLTDAGRERHARARPTQRAVLAAHFARAQRAAAEKPARPRRKR